MFKHMIVTWLRCLCGKLHTAGGISRTTKCQCGLGLWEQIP
ncbi:hypothetical protein SEA_FAUST_246 [Streptomyces phage Faust]|uniref:Uncharacterized protein n=1 Tax=Streptomyces phage Faust TaxID=2767565 RepID=A0A7G9UZ63_9CAUD|nr:hypothetical protein PP456_gp041 [Streptomyces phage Faust]QNN99318.1 hypothetical protein SEA_FAUST_246 [Streptomyces phage Faust]